MAVIDKKLIHFTNLATFEQRLNAGDIKDTSIVFIQDAKRIWTHGLYYSSPYTKEEIDKLFVGSNVTLDEYSGNGVAEIISTDTVNEAFGKIEDYLGNLEDFIETNVGERLGSLENTKLDKIIKFTDITASNWVSDSTYSEFPYRCDLACSGVTANMYAEVAFAVDHAVSGRYAPICETGNNIVSIWSNINNSITIPTVIITA